MSGGVICRYCRRPAVAFVRDEAVCADCGTALATSARPVPRRGAVFGRAVTAALLLIMIGVGAAPTTAAPSATTSPEPVTVTEMAALSTDDAGARARQMAKSVDVWAQCVVSAARVSTGRFEPDVLCGPRPAASDFGLDARPEGAR